jgi:hypothetical protein
MDDHRLADLERRVAAMADALARLSHELRTRRLVVVDDHGAPRVVADVTRGTAELRVTDGDGAEVVLHAGAADLDGVEPSFGAHLRHGGDALAEVDAAPDDGGRWRVRGYAESPVRLSAAPAPRRPPRTARSQWRAAPGPSGS